MTQIYRTGTIKRVRRTNAEIAQLESQILEALRNDHPQAVRHVFYLMTNPRLPVSVPKTDTGSNNGYRVVQNRLKLMREAGTIPYGWITDASRRGYFVSTYRDSADFLRSVAGLYRADLWQNSNYYCEVWTESRSIAGVIEDDCRDLAVSLYPAGGFTSISLAYEAAEAINAEADGREVVIFYVGDYDPAGVLIDVALQRELRKHLDPSIRLDFRRLGITAQQIAEHDLPTKPRKEKDRRSLHILETVEAEAMPAGILRQLLRKEIEALLPKGALVAAKVAEKSERDLLKALAGVVDAS